MSVSTLTREQYFARVKEMGKQRAAMLTCMTCAQTAERWGTWDTDPRRALEREIQWEAGWSRANRGQQLRDELLAIAALIEAHRDEFDTTLTTIQQKRAWIEQKNARAKRA